MKRRVHVIALGTVLAVTLASGVSAQGVVSEKFTGDTTENPWYFFNGACLTASTAAASANPGQIPGCTAIKDSYYKENLTGGENGAAGEAQTLPDSVGNGALRFTNGYIKKDEGGYRQNGAIVSKDTFPTGQGVQITFKTVTYRGDSGGAGKDGADGISFFLMDGSKSAGVGSWGGSLGYTCSNTNTPYDGLLGGYIGLGVDEYGNFLNGTSLVSGYTGNTASGDNTALGYGYKPNRIGLRGAGSISWDWLHATYPLYYPLVKLDTDDKRRSAVQKTCSTGKLWDYSSSSSSPTEVTATKILGYAPITNAYKELPGDVLIAKEYAAGGYKRGDATPIVYNLKITQDGLLSFGYSINGAAWQSVISKQSIAESNGPMPSTFRFGFAGATGGSTNIHEILCFKAQPLDLSSSSTSVNEKQSAKIETGTQAYFAFYDPNEWTGRVTANDLKVDEQGNLFIENDANWDASCVLTGVPDSKSCPTTKVAGPLTAPLYSSRIILTWNGTTGIPFRWTNLTTPQKTVLGNDRDRLNYLRGLREDEVKADGTGKFRARASVLADIIDSSPTWVGPPSLPYLGAWKDRLFTSTAMSENSGTENYNKFVSDKQTRPNVVYVGANDGLVHGFRTGGFDTNGNWSNAVANDGKELLAYMPAAVVNGIHPNEATLDYSSTQYGHNFFVNATPATGDLFYGGKWHTWLVGGLGAGGSAIYALDITDPSATRFKESNASTLVIGEWNPSTISCSAATDCGKHLGKTYGVPQIRRLHNGKWAVIFGNGIGGSSGDAGIYIMTLDKTSAAPTFYYLSTGKGGSNGIVYASAADLDGDHVSDYVYAGDLLGNLWRFDLTSNDETKWAVSTGPLFTAPTGQAITTRLVIASGPSPLGQQQLMIAFGTGRKTPQTNSDPVVYSSGTHAMYGIWDWNLTDWNSKSPLKYAALTAANTGLTASSYTLAKANLTAQVFTVNAAKKTRDIATNAVVCWKSSIVCTPSESNSSFGWYAELPGTSEQIVFNPQLLDSAFVVNSVIPPTNSILSCTTNVEVGYTYALNVLSGGAFKNFFPKYGDELAGGVETNATGTPFHVRTGDGRHWIVFQTVKDDPETEEINPPANSKANRLTWIQLR